MLRNQSEIGGRTRSLLRKRSPQEDGECPPPLDHIEGTDLGEGAPSLPICPLSSIYYERQATCKICIWVEPKISILFHKVQRRLHPERAYRRRSLLYIFLKQIASRCAYQELPHLAPQHSEYLRGEDTGTRQ